MKFIIQHQVKSKGKKKKKKKTVFISTLGNPDGVDQDEYSTKGNQWILSNYPKINFITNASIFYDCPIKVQ